MPLTATRAVPTRDDQRQVSLHGGWLVLAWAGWSILAALSLIDFVSSLYGALAAVHRPCQADTCLPGQPNPATAQTLHQLGLSVGAYSGLSVGLVLVEALAACGLSLIILRRRPTDLIALLATSTFITQALFEDNYLNGVFDNPASPWHTASLWLSYLSPVQFLFLCALFPTGRPAPRWMGWVLGVICLIDLPASLFPAMPFGNVIEVVFIFSGFPLVVGSMIYRYRWVSTPAERQQTKWVIFGIVLVMFTFFAWLIPQLIVFSGLSRPGSVYDVIGHPLFTISTLAVPICFGIAILRYRLWEIDVIINRTLVYGVLTALLAVVYFGSVVLLQRIAVALAGPAAADNPLILVVSTLLIAAIFTPLRRRVQATIDRRFYRSRYDAARTLERFAASLRTQTDLATLNDHLVAAVEETMRPAHVSLWVRPAASATSMTGGMTGLPAWEGWGRP